MVELNNIQQINTIRNTFKDIKNYLTTSYLSCCFICFEITHRKAINKLLKNGFSICENKRYIKHNSLEDFYINKSPVSYANYFLCRISLEDFNKLKEIGVKEVNKENDN